MLVDQLLRQAADVACPVDSKPADLEQLFMGGLNPVQGGSLPWEFLTDLTETGDPGACLLYYQWDGDVRLAVVRGTASAQSVRIVEF